MATKKDRRADAHPMDPDEDRRAGLDRRQWERVLVDLEVDYRSDDTFLFAYITDISAMGIFVRTVTPEPPGTRLNLRFCPAGMGVLECEGEVIWINPYRPGDRENINPGMGVRFVDLDYTQRDRLRQLVRTFAYLSDESNENDENSENDDEGGGTPPPIDDDPARPKA